MTSNTNVTRQHPLVVGCVLLGVAAIPDAMVVPVLHGLCVHGFGVSEGAAHAFMAVNLVGAIVAVGLLALLNRRVPTSTLLGISAASSVLLMSAMAVAPSWWALLVLRGLEGGADLILLAIPFRMIASCGSESRYGARMGLSFTVMFLSLGLGVGLGTVIGSDHAPNVLWAAAVSSGILLLIVAIVHRTVDNMTASPRPSEGVCPLIPREWIGGMFLGIDRLLSALVSVTLPILLVSGFDVDSANLAVALGGMFLALAIFSAPAGYLADRVGGVKVRIISATMCSFGLAGLGLMLWLPPVVILAPCLLLYGAGAAGLMPSAFSASVRRQASTLVFSSLQAIGQCGYAIGIVGGWILLSSISLPPQHMLTALFPIAGLLFLIANLLLVAALRTLLNKVG